MTTTPPNRQQRATDHPARLAAGPHRAAQHAGARRNRPIEPAELSAALSWPSAALLPTSPAHQRSWRRLQGQPDRAQRRCAGHGC